MNHVIGQVVTFMPKHEKGPPIGQALSVPEDDGFGSYEHSAQSPRLIRENEKGAAEALSGLRPLTLLAYCQSMSVCVNALLLCGNNSPS